MINAIMKYGGLLNNIKAWQLLSYEDAKKFKASKYEFVQELEYLIRDGEGSYKDYQRLASKAWYTVILQVLNCNSISIMALIVYLCMLIVRKL